MKQKKFRMISGVMLGVLLLIGARLEVAFGETLKTIQTHKTQDLVITLQSASGQGT
jgi:hypothetical protein